MKRLFTIVSLVIIANIAISPVVLKADMFPASSEHKREITKEYSVSSSPSLSIKNEFGKIKIIEGADDKIIFRVTITGKGKNDDEAKKYAETVNVDFKQNGNGISAKTTFGKINCNNCGRSVDYEVTVPKMTKYELENKYGDINMNNAYEPMVVNVEFGKFYANVISDIDLSMKYGGATINKCGHMNIKSGFSKYKLGEVGSLSGKIEYDGFDIKELGSADINSGFSNVDIDKLNKSLKAKGFSYGSLGIDNVDSNFSEIKVDASFSKVKVSMNEKHNFKAALYTSFGDIKTGRVVFYEKSLDKKDAIVGIAGKVKEPSAIVEISNSYGNIVFD